MEKYNPQKIEKKWQKIWDESKAFCASNESCKPKYYCLVEFPYPSGEGLHVGHPRPYTALDIVARKRRLEGYNVLFPMGWDAFGLPTENFAVKNHIHPKLVTANNVKHFKAQLKSIGYSFDWDREVNTTDPEYFKWTQWIFLKLFERGLAYKKEMPINWCPSCKIGLANEEVVDGHCERCSSTVSRRVRTQWMLKITEYADRLIDDLKIVNFPERVKSSQVNWIGRSYGAEVDFKVKDTDKVLTVYTTRPDTIFGATYMVIAAEHPLIDEYSERILNYEELINYRKEVSKKSDLDRTELSKEKTGFEIKGLKALNPASGKEIPIWVSDYVLMSYGTGAIMAVPAHDTRDYEFAKKFNLPILEVISGGDVSKEAYTDTETGELVNSDFLNGLSVEEAKKKITEFLEEKGIGHKKKNYKLRDWVFSRQRYWGEPIPLICCEDCGFVPLDEDKLPLLLPEVENYEPTDNGDSPLASISEWVNVKCPKCGKPAKRETDTMPQWAGSSWYYLRYMDPKNQNEFASSEALKYWGIVDWYDGGMEHTTLHLLYSRFWHKFLYDLGKVKNAEPYLKRTSHGMILGKNGEKMSKSRGNVVNPDDIIRDYGADTLRVYEMFIGDFEKSAPWSEEGVRGARRFLDRLWKLSEMVTDEEESSLEILLNQTIKKVSEDYETLKYNTAIAKLMTLLNAFYERGRVGRSEYRIYLILLNPTAPHITEELWERAGFSGHIFETQWPKYDPEKIEEDNIELPVQVNGKLKSTVLVPRSLDKEALSEFLKGNEQIQKHLDGKQVVKEIFVPGRIYNFIVR